MTSPEQNRKISGKLESNQKWMAKAHGAISRLCSELVAASKENTGKVTVEVNFKNGQIVGVYSTLNRHLAGE